MAVRRTGEREMNVPRRVPACLVGVLALLLAGWFGMGVRAAALDGETLSYEDLVGLVSAHDVRSIEELLPLLPQDYRSEFTLMHDSLSLQPSTFESPRVIMTGPRATLVIAFSSDPEAFRYNVLEIIQFREDGAPGDPPNPATPARGFEFREIVFSDLDPPGPPAFGPANPPLCFSCHGGSDPRPNWEVYSQWPGAYGSSVDQVPLPFPGDIARFFGTAEAPCPTPDQGCFAYSSAPFAFRPFHYQGFLLEACGDCSQCMFECGQSCLTTECLPGGTDVQPELEAESDGFLQFLASYQADPRHMWLENVPAHYAVVGNHFEGRNNAVLTTRFAKLNFQRLVERYRGGSPVSDTYTHTKRLIAFLLTRCLQDWGSLGIERSDYLPPGFSNLVPLGFEIDMQCDASQLSTYGKCNYDQIFGALGYDTLNWPTSFFKEVNRSFSVPALDVRPATAFLYWLRDRDLGDIGTYIEDTSPPTCTTPEVDHLEHGRTSCTAEITLTGGNADQNACTALATAARDDLSQWLDPPATVACCVGDCDCGGTVTIGELITSVNILLGTNSVNSCLPIDHDISDGATVNELILAVDAALDPPCSAPSGAGASAGAPASNATLDVPNTSGASGQSVTLDITLSTTGISAAGAQLDLLYPATVLSAGSVSSSWDPGVSVSNCTLASSLDPEEHQVAVSDRPTGTSLRQLTVAVVPKFSGTIQNLPNGTIASCTFQIASSASPGTYQVYLVAPGASDAFGGAVDATARVAAMVQVCAGCDCG